MDPTLPALLAIAGGSALGGGARFLISGLVARSVGETFPWGTLTVNVTGAFLLGLLLALAERGGLASVPLAWDFAAVGFLGSFTTVSSLSLQTLALARAGSWAQAATNVALSLVLGLAAAAAGVVVGGRWP